MTEEELQAAVLELAGYLGWRTAHFRPAQTRSGNWVTPVAADGAGFPDLCMTRERLIMVELKSAKGTLRPEQMEWRAALDVAGVEYHVWRPAEWLDGTIEAVLHQSSPAS